MASNRLYRHLDSSGWPYPRNSRPSNRPIQDRSVAPRWKDSSSGQSHFVADRPIGSSLKMPSGYNRFSVSQ